MTLGIPEWTKANHNDLAAIAHRIQIGIYRTRPSDYSGSHRNLRYRWAQDCAGSSAVEPSNAMRILIEPFVVKSCKGILFSQTAMVFPVFLGRSSRSGYRRSAWKTEWVIYCHCGIVVGCGGWGSLPPCLFVWSEQCMFGKVDVSWHFAPYAYGDQGHRNVFVLVSNLGTTRPVLHGLTSSSIIFGTVRLWEHMSNPCCWKLSTSGPAWISTEMGNIGYHWIHATPGVKIGKIMSHQRLWHDQWTLDILGETLESAKPQICCCHAHFVSWSGWIICDYIGFPWTTPGCSNKLQCQQVVRQSTTETFLRGISVHLSMSKGRRSDGVSLNLKSKFHSTPTTSEFNGAFSVDYRVRVMTQMRLASNKLSKSVWFPYVISWCLWYQSGQIRYDGRHIDLAPILHSCLGWSCNKRKSFSAECRNVEAFQDKTLGISILCPIGKLFCSCRRPRCILLNFR